MPCICLSLIHIYEDFATVNPYLGTDGIKPFVDVCKEEKKGIFILVKTSNPSSGEFQDLSLIHICIIIVWNGLYENRKAILSLYKAGNRGCPR